MTIQPFTSEFVRRAAFALIAALALHGPVHGPVHAQPPGSSGRINLTPEERAWVQQHPVLRSAATPDWPPFDFVTSGGEYRGIDADLLRRFGEMAGFEIEPVTAPWPELYRMLREGELDLGPGMQASAERRRFLAFTDPILDFPHAIYHRTEEAGIQRLEDLAGRRVAVEREYYEHEYLRANHPEFQLVEVENSLGALLAVSRGEADAYVGNVAVSSYLIDHNVLPNIVMGPYADLGPLQLSIGVRRDYPILVQILNKAIAALPAHEKREIISRYITTPERVALTEAEHAWIREHPVIRLGIDPEFAPFEYAGEDGTYLAMASDYVQLLNARLGINMQIVHTQGWDEAVRLARERELDVLPCLGRSIERDQYLEFTQPYLAFHRVIITRLDNPFVGGLEDLHGMRVAVQQNTSHHAFVTEQSSLSPELHPTFRDALTAVARGEADCAIGNAATTAYWIKRLGLSNLRLAVPAGEGVEELHFGVRKDWPELARILDKGIASVTEAEALAIRQKWIDLEMQPGLDIRRAAGMLAAVVAVFLPILGLISYHNRRLHREVAARIKTESALRESEENYRTLVENAHSIILRMTPPGEILFLNRYGEQFFGYPSGQIIGQNIVGTIVPETDHRGRDLASAMTKLGRNPDAFSVHENENITRDGRRVWIAWTNCPLYDAGGNVQEILCVGNDVTEQRRAADTLRRYEFIVNTVRSMMSVIDSNGCYEAVNDEWCAATGISREEAVGNTVASIWGKEAARNGIMPRLTRCLQGERVAYESAIKLPARGECICEVTMYPFTDTYDLRPRAIVVADDVTDRKAAEARLREAMQAAEAGNRAKSAFLANMSHEIRTPMNAVLGYTQLLQRVPDLSADQKHALEAIRRSGDHLLALINDILELSRIEAGHVQVEPVSFNLPMMIQDLEMMFRVRTDARGLLLEVDIAPEIPSCVRADLNRIKQVLINLIGNAIKFTERGRITVRVRRAPESMAPSGGIPLRIEVEDTGCGIPEEALESIFGSFEQAESGDARQEGAGLGLAISRNFARILGGEITVTSTAGSGSQFVFTVPVEPGELSEVPDTDAPRTVAAVRGDNGPVRVLVVDDRDTNRDLVCRMLAPLGFHVDAACNGREALDAFTARHHDIVLIDLVMPVMDGREAIRRIRALPESGPRPCIIALTASTLSEERDTILGYGADAFLRKPFRLYELLEEMRIHAGIDYEYEDAPDPGRAAAPAYAIDQARKAIRNLPGTLAERLRHTVWRGAINETLALLPELQREDTRLADLVQEYTEGFVLDELKPLWDKESSE